MHSKRTTTAVFKNSLACGLLTFAIEISQQNLREINWEGLILLFGQI